jgi:hypothetical protein
MYRIILVTAIPDSTDANGIVIVGNKITEIRDIDKLANILAFVASHPPDDVIAAQVYSLDRK